MNGKKAKMLRKACAHVPESTAVTGDWWQSQWQGTFHHNGRRRAYQNLKRSVKSGAVTVYVGNP